MPSQDKLTLHYFIISDSIGETAIKLANSIFAQFPSADTQVHKYTFVQDPDSLLEILQEAQAMEGVIFMTVADPDLAQSTEDFCNQAGLLCYNLLQPYLEEIQRRTGLAPSQEVGAQHQLSEEYFRRVEAMEFMMTYDDGKDPKSLHEAEVVLLGISRTSKTPLAMYMATQGYKVTNIPLLLEKDVPELLFQIDRNKIIGLTSDLNVLSKHRRNRLIEYGLPLSSQYGDEYRIQAELDFAEDLYRDLGIPVINVADRSIEETASIIIDILNLSIR